MRSVARTVRLMLDVVTVASIVVAVVCLACAIAWVRFDERRRKEFVPRIIESVLGWRTPVDPSGTEETASAIRAVDASRARIIDAVLGRPDDRVAALIVALLLLIVGGAAAAIDEKVANQSPSRRAAAERPVAVSEKDLSAFSAVDEFHTGPLRSSLCVVRFYARNEPPAGKWWTTCRLAERKLATVRDVRRVLAVKHQWGPYDEKVRFTIPRGTRLTYVRGTAAEQCPPNTRRCLYRGGGIQYLFPEGFDPGHGSERECASPSAEAATSRKTADDARFEQCS